VPLFVFKHHSGFTYYNYLAIVEHEFKPVLNWETQDYRWVEWGDWPEPLHNGLKLLLGDQQSVERIKQHLPHSDDTITEETLTEGATDVLYHKTGVHAAAAILAQGAFGLSSTLGTDAEASYAPRGYPYFLSTTRTKVGDYHRWVGDSAVMFNLDGRIINSRYPVKPIDYWDRAWNHPRSERTRESEDRVFSRDPEMSLDSVTSIHVYLNPDQMRDPESRHAAEVKQTILNAYERNIKVHAYVDADAWRLQNSRRQVDPNWFARNIKVAPQTPRTPSEFMGEWIELLKKNPGDELSDRADRLRYNMLHYSDTISTLKNDIHNGRKPDSADYKHVVAIERYMRANRLPNLKALIDHLKVKWQRSDR